MVLDVAQSLPLPPNPADFKPGFAPDQLFLNHCTARCSRGQTDLRPNLDVNLLPQWHPKRQLMTSNSYPHYFSTTGYQILQGLGQN